MIRRVTPPITHLEAMDEDQEKRLLHLSLRLEDPARTEGIKAKTGYFIQS